MHAWHIFACFASAYFMSYALRAVNAVIAPDLMREFALSNAQLGSLSSAYFFAFALLQLPLGICLDRFGSRRTNALLLVVAALGCALFALAQNVAMLWVGRALIGAGVCGALMSALKGYRFWYPIGRQQQLAAWMLVAGTFGALASTMPVQAALPAIGWRGMFLVATGLLLACSVALWTLVPRDEERSLAPPVAGASIWAGYGEVFSDRYFWRVGMPAIVGQAGFIAMQTLWSGPWFIRVLGMTAEESARSLFVFNLVMMFAYLGLGWAAPRIERRGWTMVQVLAVGGSLVMLVQAAIAFAAGQWAWLLWLLMAVVATCYMLIQTHVGLSFPAALTGRAYSAFNLLVFGSVFLCQWLFGVVVDAFRAAGDAPDAAFRHTMLAWVVLQMLPLAVLLVWRVPRRPQEPVHAGS